MYTKKYNEEIKSLAVQEFTKRGKQCLHIFKLNYKVIFYKIPVDFTIPLYSRSCVIIHQSD